MKLEYFSNITFSCVIVTSGTCKKKKEAVGESFPTFLKKVYFSLYQYHCRGFYCLQKIVVSVVFIPGEVKKSFNSSGRRNATGNFCMYIAE